MKARDFLQRRAVVSGSAEGDGLRSQLRWTRLALGSAIAAMGLSIPTVSTFAAAAMCAFCVAWWTTRRRVPPMFVARAGVLIAFCASYYLFAVGYGFVENGEAAKNTLYVVAGYAAGYTSARRSGFPQFEVLSGVVGLLLFAVACVVAAGAWLDNLTIASRAAPNIWIPGETVNGPGLGAMASPAMCLLGVAWFALSGPVGSRIGTRALFLLLGGGGAFVNVVLQNRGPWLALALAAAAAAVQVGAASRRQRVVRAFWAAVVIVGLGVASTYLVSMADFESLSIYQRFAEQGLNTPRYELWGRGAAGLLDSPMGGRSTDLGGERFVHNLWLDVAYDSGVIPFSMLTLFALLHLPAVKRGFQRLSSRTSRLTVSAVGSAFAVAFMTEPVMSFSMIYVGVGAFALGSITATGDIRER